MYHDEVARTFCGECWTQDRWAASMFGLNFIKAENKPGLSRDSALIHTGGNSGYQAINLLWHFGVSRILLLGFDMKGGHWHGKHPRGLNNYSPHHDWVQRFRPLAAELDIEVINCTPGSALDAFPVMRLEDAL